MEFSYKFRSRLLVGVHSTDRRRSRKASDMGFNGSAFVRYVAWIRLLQQQSSFSELSVKESREWEQQDAAAGVYSADSV
jgi:hypothetical protein